MPVGLLTLELHIPDAQSLKDKRQVLRSLKDKLRREFNVAVAELSITTPGSGPLLELSRFRMKRSTSKKCCRKFWTRRTAFSFRF